VKTQPPPSIHNVGVPESTSSLPTPVTDAGPDNNGHGPDNK
jgi:hypothetical protein